MSVFGKLPKQGRDGADQQVRPANTVGKDTWGKVMQAPSDPHRPGNSAAWIRNFYGTAGKEALS